MFEIYDPSTGTVMYLGSLSDCQQWILWNGGLFDLLIMREVSHV